MRTRKLILFSLLFLSFAFSVFAQTDSVDVGKEKFTKKLFFQAGFGLMAYNKVSGNNSYDASFLGTVGYPIHRLVQPGITTGYEEYSQFSGMPLSLYLGGNLLNRDNSVFYYSNFGYTHFFNENNDRYNKIEGGRNFEAGLGYSWKLYKVSLRLSLGWKRQRLKTQGGNNYYYSYAIDPLFNSSFAPNPFIENTSWRMDRIVYRMVIEF